MDGHIKRLYGVYRAVVDDNNDPQYLRRLKVKVQSTSFDRDATTNWIWPILSTKRPPAIGSGVYVLYLGGDPDYPVWIGEFSSPEDVQGVFSYGSWFSTQDQTPAVINTAYPITVNNADYEEGITVVDGSKFKVDLKATYNFQFSLQLHSRGGGGSGHTVQIWLRKNGTNVPNSATRIDVPTNNPYQVAAWNFFIELERDDYVELAWSATNLNMAIEANTATSPAPAIPSVIVTMNQIA
jgi:hypothetical protein